MWEIRGEMPGFSLCSVFVSLSLVCVWVPHTDRYFFVVDDYFPSSYLRDQHVVPFVPKAINTGCQLSLQTGAATKYFCH